MRSHHVRLAALTCHVCYCRGWVPTKLPSVALSPTKQSSSRPWPAIVKDNTAGSTSSHRRTLRRPRTWLTSTRDEDSWNSEARVENWSPLRPNVDEDPLSDDLANILRESGLVDTDGNPTHTHGASHTYDDEDIYGTGSDKQRAEDAVREEQFSDVPGGDDAFREKLLSSPDEYGLMDTSINEAAFGFGFPVEFFLDMVTRWGVQPPIDQDVRLGDLITAEQAFALGEALTGLDAADVRDNYLDERIEDLAVELDMPLPALLQACAANKINLPQGADTHITVDEYKSLLDAVTEGGSTGSHRRSFEDNRMRHHWFGRKELEARLAAQAQVLKAEGSSAGEPEDLWREGPPVIGLGENEIHPDDVHITGRIFGEELFSRAAQGSDDDMFDFDEEFDEDSGDVRWGA